MPMTFQTLIDDGFAEMVTLGLLRLTDKWHATTEPSPLNRGAAQQQSCDSVEKPPDNPETHL
jgi:hypothetical protein